jgi:hypothetical protein
MRVGASAVDMPPQMGTRSWLRGLPLRSWFPLVAPLYAVFAKLFFGRNFFLQRIFLFPPENKLSSQRGPQLLPYKASPIRTSTCTTSPLSSPLFALCVRYVVFEGAEGGGFRGFAVFGRCVPWQGRGLVWAHGRGTYPELLADPGLPSHPPFLPSYHCLCGRHACWFSK